MGAVYLAQREDDFRQRVALKLIRPGKANLAILRRFYAERQILAGLEHPGIARIFDGGSTDNELPFFVMEYVEGEPIDRACDALPLRRRLELFQEVCAALQVAHQNLVAHRDHGSTATWRLAGRSRRSWRQTTPTTPRGASSAGRRCSIRRASQDA